MKKAKMIGKKTLSVFLAVLMVLTAWVWVAPQKAEAANGSYYVKITWKCVNKRTYDNNYTGYNNRGNGQCGLSLFYKSNNGRGTESEVYWNIGKGTGGSTGVSNTGWMNTTGTYSATATVSGFPTRLFIFSDNNYLLDESEMQVEKIEVGSSSSATLTTLWAGTAYLGSSTEQYYIEIKDGVGTGNHKDYAKVTTTTSNWVYPYVKSTTSISSATAVANIGIPPLGDNKDTSISTRSIQYYATDNYGVRYEPTSYSVSGVQGLTTGSGWSCGNAYKIEATSSTTKSTVGISQTATVTMNWNNGKSTSGQKDNTTATFLVYNPRYKITFNGNGGTLGTAYTYGYYGRPINHSDSIATSNNVSGLSAELFPTTGIKEGYSFKGMFTAASGGSQVYGSTTITDTKTYFAQWNINNYTATFYGKKANDAGTGTVEYVISTSTVPYNTKPTAPTTVDSYSLGDYDYVFNNTWDDEITNIGVNGAEYRAGYDPVFVEADYSAVNEIIAEAQDIINSENYEAIYSESSREKLETAVGSVVPDLGRTSQSIVDGYVTRIREAIDGLGRQKYSVIFIDQTDNSVIEMRYPVYYGDAITMPADPVKGFDSNYHYRFHSWQPSESGDDITFVSKNMIIYATFDKIAHTYTDTQLPSNCTTQAGVLHKCSCGYEYVEYSGSVGTEHSLETEWTIDIAPTCTSAGSKSYHCTRCSYRDSVTEIPALGHDLVYQGVVISPGCENDGAEVSECQRCGYDNYTIIPSGNHNWTEQVVAPTCTSSGYTIKTCSICGDEDIVSFVDPIAHTYVENTDEYIAPTCTGLGKKVSYCSCGAQKVETVDATNHQWDADPTVDFKATCTTKGQQSIHCSVCDIINQESITEIPENGHTWGNEVCEQKETCGVKGLYVKTCTVCSEDRARTVEALAHNYDTSTVAPTCTTKGYTIETCSNCGDVKYTNETPALNHAWTSTTHAADCTHSAYIEHICGNDSTHNYVEYVNGSTVELHTWTQIDRKDADCENDGYIDYKCSVCDKATKREILPKLGHAYPETWTVEKEATNNEDGKWTRKCANCKNVETVVIPAGGHTFNTTTPDSKTDPTCTTPGSATYKCKTKGHTCGVEITVEIPVKQHSIAIDNKEASCTEKGHSKTYCSVCKKEFNSVEIPVKAHNFVAQDAVAPTCTTAGYTPYKCSACGFTYNVFNGAQATGHNYTAAVTKDATCTEEGVKTFTCQNDNSHKYTETIPAKGHTYDAGTVVQNQSCTDVEKTEYKCACGDKYTVITKEAKGHTYTNWTVVTPATADKSGVQMGTCACGDVKYDVLAPIGAHSFTETITKNPSCTEKGEKTFVCNEHENCSANYKAEIPATGHTQKIVYTAPTCITAGSTKVVCSVESCKAEILSTSIPATSKHDFSGEGKVTTAPTCTGTGIMTYTCTTVGCTATKTETIPAKGHVLSTTVNDAKCGEKGSVVTECANCNDPSVENTVELSAKGHIWGATPIETKAADCENNGSETYKCENCDKTNVVVIPALGHDWNDWTVVPSTNGSVGSVSRTCKRETCKKVESVEIPAGGHNLVVGSKTDATCLNEGTITYICDNHKGNANCGITVTVTIPAKGHTNVIETTPATCETDGSIVEKCGICENVIHKTTVIPKKGHAWDNGVIKKGDEATCTTDGTKTYTCANDASHIYEETIPATGHKITAVTTQATCIKEGSVVEKCSQCTYEVKVATIPKLQHDFSGAVTVTKEATCTEDGSKTIQCKTEGCTATTTVIIPHTGHIWNAWTITKPATNTDDGEMTRTCSNSKCTETVVIPKGGHIWDNGTVTKDATCTETGTMVYKCNNSDHANCGITITVTIPVRQHNVVTAKQDATCTADGFIKTYCAYTDCGEVFSNETTKKIAHVYKAGTEVAPTCTTSGYTPYTCKCGDSYNKYDESKPATGHKLVEGTSTATCVDAGEMTLKCNNSGCNYSRTVNVPALGHNYKKVSDTNATCAAASTETYKCSRCTASYTISVGEKSAEHTWDETKWQVQVSATPSSLGYKTNACTVCGQIKVETIPATGEHNFNKENSRQDATCTADGWIKYECSTHTNCGLTSTVTIPATGHTEAHEYKAATCTDDGYSRMVCSAENNAVLAETVIPALGHLYGEGTVTNATCKDTGKIEYTCTRENCNDTHTTIIEKNSNAHQYVTVVKDSTCTVPGKVSTKCNLCGNQIEVETLPLVEHTWNDGEIKEGDNATCTADGKKTFTCKVCTAEKTETIAKLGHNWGTWTETKASTNTEKGVLTRKCLRGCTETAEIPEGGHNLVVDSANSKVPSCTESGYTKYICNVKHTGDVDCGITVTVTLDKLQHKLETTKTDATCETEGSVVTKCTKCETSTFTTTIPATGHTYNEGVKTDATCTATGKIVYTCTADKCGKTKEVNLDKLQHNYVAGTPVAATCTSSGYTPYKCATCESEYVIITSEAKTHTFVKDSSSATCTYGGKMILKCACGATMETDVPALGHDYKKVSETKATCKDDATETYKCSRCDNGYTVSVGAKTDAHNMAWETVAATNTSLGYKIGTCGVCGKVEVEIIPATGEHVFDKLDKDESYAATCENDGLKVYYCSKHENCTEKSSVVIPKLGHTEQLIYSAATCTSEGSASIYCDVCKTTLSTEKIPALNHVWGDEVITQPTCNSTGSVVFKCGGADCTETKTVIIPENENAHKLTMDAKLATCKEAGYVKVTCTNEGCTYNEETNLPMLHHDWSTWTKTDSTNNKAGSWVSTCSICKDERKLEIPAGGHKFENAPVTITEATCENEGEVVYKCSAHDNCGVEVTVKTAMLQHEYATNTVDASCSKEGSVTVSCRVCGDKLVDNMATAKLPHTYEETETKATCTEAGYITYTCKKCGDSYDKFISQPIGHTYTKLTINPTCTTAGYTTYKCSVCGQGYTSDFVEANGHKYNEGEKTDATCTTAGKIIYTCTAENCGHSYEVTLSMLNHEYDVENTVDPTCTANGYTTYKCKTCDSSYVVIGDPAKTHNYSTVVSSTATCTAGGTLTLKCADCKHTMETAVPALGHNYVENIKRATDATCAAAATKTFECDHSNCNAEYTVSVGSKTDAHDWNDWFTVKEADYTSIGYKTRTCKVCGKLEVETINATGAHDLQEVKRDAPTCTENGKIYYECKSHSDCGIKNEVEIPALGHDEKLSYKAATCTEAGFTKIICNVKGCDYEAEATTIPALGHAWNDEAATIVNATCQSEGSVSLGCKNCNKTTEVVIPVNADAHKTVVTTNKATCTEAGSVVTSCELCKKELLTTTLTALGHDWSAWDINPSTYTAPGSMSRICQTCKKPETVEIPAGGHKFNNVPSSTTAATCAAEGSATYKCSVHNNCGVEVTVKLSKVHHNLKIDTVDASCTNGGSITVSCVNCDYTSIITTGILAHEYQENGTVAATCTTAGYTIMKCKNCEATYNRFDSQPLGHNFDDSIADNVTIVAAKCEEDGSKTVKCSRKDCDETKVTVIPATGHKYENEKSSVTTAPTCTEMGYTTYTCDVCKVSYTTNFVKPKGHDWGDWMVASGADGDVIKRVCKTDANHTEQYNIPSGGHSFDTTKPAATVQGTCQAEGSMKFNCTAHENCGVTITVNTGFGSHNWSQWEIKAATNEADGSWTHKCLTSGCNESETLVIPRGHYLAEDSKQYVKPECNKVGQRVYTCTAHDNCTVKIVVVLEMTQHTIVTVNEAATCQNDGLIKTYCEKCGKVFSDITLKKVPHDYDKNKDGKLDTADAVYTAPVQNADGTCTPGYYTFTCQTAGCEDTKVEGDSTSYEVRFFDGNGDLVATTIVLSGLSATAPTETPVKDADGNYHYTFSGWDRDFSKIEKDLDVYATFEKEAHFGGEATCNTKAICDKCNKAYGNVDESKHIIVTKSKSASCEADGWVEYYCTSEGCEYNYSTGKYLKKETIGASGHVYGQWKVVQNGTCEIPQIQQRKCINYGCNKVEEKLSQSTHTWLLEPRIEPTCSSVGYTEFKYCVTCNLQIDRVEIPKIDHRDLDGNGYCDYCGTSKGTPKCNCMCHSTGIMKFFYKIVRFFWMITKSSRSCSCGAVHY